jgi:hypothetical protein
MAMVVVVVVVVERAGCRCPLTEAVHWKPSMFWCTEAVRIALTRRPVDPPPPPSLSVGHARSAARP